ncbi:MAG TPA: hypothetical protein VOB72_20625 [Candidatus Dormibacteraeota bacterium]|nr:hypothetical protein [Candidatus Dormibacteraeota bacterium]
MWVPDGHAAYGTPVELDALGPDLASTAAAGIDRAGVVAGSSFDFAGGTRAVAWTPAGAGGRVAIDLGALAGGAPSIGFGIDAAGVVAGFSDGDGFGAAVWRPDVRGGYDAADALPPLPGGTFAFVNGIGPGGIVVGSSNGEEPGFQHATIWLPRGGEYRPVDLSGPGGVANASAGDFVAGTRLPPASSLTQALIWRLVGVAD